jgi:tetratricopeptide (TPR) repeat protein
VNHRLVLVALLALASAPGVASAADPSRDEPYAFATLDNGAFVGFALLRAEASAAGGQIGEIAFPHSNSVNRVLVDQEAGAYFGYSLEVEPVSSRRKFRVAVKPLERGIEKELRRRQSCGTCPELTLLGPLPRYPAPRLLDDGDLFTLDLLVNPRTGERIVDAVRVSSTTITSAVMRAAAARLTEALTAVQRAEVFAARGKHALAVDEYERALQINPQDAVTRNKLGVSYQQLRRTSEAEKQYKEALRLNPVLEKAWNNLGSIQHDRGQLKNAIQSYKKAVSLRPQFPEALMNMGVAYFAQGRFDAGFEAFQAAYKLDPKIFDAQGILVVGGGGVPAATQSFYFAKICAAAGHVDAAIEHLRKAVAAGFRDFSRVARDPDFRAVLADPRYKQLLRDYHS